MPFVQNDKKEAFESWFSDVIKPGFRKPLKMPSFYAEPKGGVAESNAEDSWISEVEKLLLKNQLRGRIQTEVS